MGRSGCCTGFLCLGSRKRGKRIVPATRMHDGSYTSSNSRGTNGDPQSGTPNQYASLSPLLLAPPSSPASFQNSAVQSSAQSPSTFPVANSLPSASSQVPLETTATMFQTGPYAHETALVSPPVFSTFTTAPSTAPFTPPPELATHVTTPSSPDVPFARLLASSFGTKASVRLQPAPTYFASSASRFASPDIFSADDLQAAYQLYPGSPLAHLISPTSGTGDSTPFPERENPSQSTAFPDIENSVAVATMFFPGTPLVAKEPGTSMEVDVESLLSQTLNSCSFQEFWQEDQQVPPAVPSFLACGDDTSESMLVGHVKCELDVQLVDDVNDGSDGCQKRKCITLFGSVGSDRIGEQNMDGITGNSRLDRGHEEGFPELSLSNDLFSMQLQQGKSQSFGQSDSGLSQIRLVCNLGCSRVRKKVPGDREGTTAEAVCESKLHLLKLKSSSFDQNSGEILAWEAQTSDKTPVRSVPKLPLMEEGREESETHSLSSSGDSGSVSVLSSESRSPDNGSCIGCVRSRHLSVAATKDCTSYTPHLNSTCQKLETAECDRQRQDCCTRCLKPENRFDELEVAFKQATQQSAGFEVKDRMAAHREQQYDTATKWIRSGIMEAKLHQRSVAELGSMYWDSQVGPST